MGVDELLIGDVDRLNEASASIIEFCESHFKAAIKTITA